MGKLLPTIRAILVELIDRIDNGRCSTTDEQEAMFMQLLETVTDKEKRVSKYNACKHLNMSRSKFDKLVSDGKIPKGRKEAGWKELSWSLEELDRCKKK